MHLYNTFSRRRLIKAYNIFTVTENVEVAASKFKTIIKRLTSNCAACNIM